jgi:hypothetical protein
MMIVTIRIWNHLVHSNFKFQDFYVLLTITIIFTLHDDRSAALSMVTS